MSNNKNLARAFVNKDDEFYTKLSDIENELRHYKNYFKGKTILCNCDDPYESNFFKYFALNFNSFELKKLICTCYDGSPIMGQQISFFSDPVNIEISKKAYKIELTEVNDLNKDGSTDLDDISQILKAKKLVKRLKNNGDFRSDECMRLLKESDIVITNPPFSLLKEYVPLLIDNKKDFIIIGNLNASHYKEIFPLIQENKLWFGYTNPKEFIKPDKTVKKFGNTCWYTNLDIEIRHEDLILYKKYNKEDYPKYVNYDAIDVSDVNSIPIDYEGYMGVPDGFLRKYNPEQFRIIGYGRGDFIPEIKNVPQSFLDDYHAIGGKGHITSGMKTLCFYDSKGKPCFPYSRIIIQKRK